MSYEDANEANESSNREIYDKKYDNNREVEFNPQDLLIMKKKDIKIKYSNNIQIQC